jgi:predicted outer membrane repeat protein
MYNYNGSPTLTNCRFIQNCAIALDGGEGAGGAIGNWDSSPTLTNCIFTGNIAGHDGGGMWSYESNPVLVNCFFSGNLAREGGSGSYGGGMWSYDGSASLINCTFTANTARSSQIGQAGGGLYAEYLTELTLTNCIFWGNTSDGVSEEAAQICIMNGAVNINYGCVQGWTGELGGIANIGDNPLFVNSGDGDYHLQPDSPCVDTGDNSAVPQSVTTDLDGNPRIVNGTVDMGAYELGVMRIIYVDDTARGANNGSSWADAYNYLQDALRVATSGTEIRIAQGTYKPDQTTNFRSPRGDRAATFRLKNGVTIKGGYAGFGAPIPDARDIERFKTILSGDLNGDDRNTVEPYNLPREPSRMDNSLHVVTASGTNKSAILDGVTITAGHANDYIDDLINGEYGGGMYNKGGSPTIKNCTFLRNPAFAVEYSAGGGLYNEDGSPILINCRFIHNAADASIRDHGGGDGGAIAEHDSNSILIDCTFIANVAAGNHGGAIYHCGGDPELKGCTFRDNFAQKYGGGLCNWWGKVKLSGCTFVGNTAGSDAGGMYNCGDSSLSNCEFVGNRCRQNGGGFSSDGLNPTIGNCRFTENSAENAGGAIANRVSSPTITKCTFTANTAGFGGGGGIYNRENANPTVSDCTFTRNRALLDYGGGGMCNNASSPRVSNCTFTQNKADDNGGAVSNWYGSSPTFTSCLFVENTARTCGGLHSYENCNPTVIDCKFIRNSTGSSGGAMSIGVNCNATVVNCLFAQNSAGTHAGGLYSYSSNPTLINCTFAANFAPNGSALAFASATNLPVNDAKLANCILWDRGGEIWKGDDSTIAITYSDIKGGWPGMGNINADPLFADPCDGNYHLRPHSPCINKGDNSAVPPSVTFDLDGNERIMFHTVDMGAYEFQGPMIIFVDDDATGANNGSSWKDAYKFLQDALTIASKGCEIRVAQGIYRPDRAIGVPIEHGNRTATFQLKNGVIIKGGYAGVTEPRSDIRDANAYESILSGDLLGNDASMSPIDPTRDNSLHVVTGSETNSTAVLDGFTITAGNANQVNPYLSPYAHGGGMYNEGGSPTVVNCTFTANSAAYFGAGMCNWQGSSPALTNCTFADNSAGNRGGGVYNWSSRPKLNNCTFSNNQARLYGGGLYGEGDSDATITDCIFTGNRTDEAGGGGGAICNNNSDTIIANCIFADNTGKNFGGAIDNQTWSRPKIVNCLFVGNRAGIFGGAIDNCNETRPSIINCTFAENLAPAARAVGCYGEPPTGPSNVQLTNCILRDGGDEIANKDNSTVTVTYSDIKGGWSGEGNIDADPVFADPCDGNYHIRPRSPCINTGNNSAIPPLVRTDLDGRPRIIGRRIDMGCYEFNHIPVANAGLDQTVYAGPDGTAKVMLDGSTSFDEDGQPLTYKWSWQVGGRTFAAGSGDGIINIRDFAHLAKKWLQPERPFADVETLAGDNRVGPMDLALIAQAWLSTPDSPRWDPRLDIAPPGPTPTIILPVGRHVIQLVVNDGIDDSRPDWVVITVLDSMEAGLDIYPPVIMRSDPLPPAILTILYLPPGVTADQVDAELPLLLYPGRIESMSQYVFETDMDGTIITTIFGFFDKTRLLRAVSENGNIELRVTGRLKTGQSFCGCDTVMIID